MAKTNIFLAVGSTPETARKAIEITDGGGGGVTGSPNAIVYVNPAGNGAATSPAFLGGVLDAFGRPCIRDFRFNVGAGRGVVHKLGAWSVDGDPQDVISEGLVTYGGNSLGNGPDGTQGGMGFYTPNSFGVLQAIPGVNGGNPFYSCGYEDGGPLSPFGLDGFIINDNTNTPIAWIKRSDGTATFKAWGLGFAPTNTVMDTYATVTRQFHFPNIAGTGLVEEDGSGQVFIGATAKQHGSNAGVQMNSIVANRGAYRANQYGNNTGVPGITGFKSRGATVGSLGVVQVGDTIFRATAVGVTDNGSLPLSGMIGLNVTYVAAGQGWIGTEFEVRTCSAKGPTNNHARRFAVSSEGIASVSEAANKMAGIAITGPGGTILVANDQITATSRIALTIQDSNAGVPGAVPTAGVYVSARVPGVSFTIQSLAPADVGVMVYYQIWEPCSA